MIVQIAGIKITFTAASELEEILKNKFKEVDSRFKEAETFYKKLQRQRRQLRNVIEGKVAHRKPASSSNAS